MAGHATRAQEQSFHIPEIAGMQSDVCPISALNNDRLKEVKDGTVLILTRWGKPVGALVPVLPLED